MTNTRLARFSSALLLLVSSSATGQAIKRAPLPLAAAHAHNDYYHPRPLLDALDQGFCSVEADIYLVDGHLLVGHDPDELHPERTLEALYLDPLRERVARNHGRVHVGGPPLTLLVDIKSAGEPTFDALHQRLARYRSILTRVEDGKQTVGAVTVIISGNRPMERIAARSPRFASIDGRLSDLDSTMPHHLMPWISDHWGRHFQWRGAGEMPLTESRRLRHIVQTAHRSGRRVRFWATPEDENLWKVLREAGVDLINTDDLPGLRKFLTNSAVTSDRSDHGEN